MICVQSPRHSQQNSWRHCVPISRVSIGHSIPISLYREKLTSHVETGVALFDVHSTSWTVLAVAPHPVLGLVVVGVAVFPLRVVLVARQPGVPGNLVSETHFEAAFVAGYVRIWIFVLLVDLPAVAGAAQAGTKTRLLRQMREKKIVVIPVAGLVFPFESDAFLRLTYVFTVSVEPKHRSSCSDRTRLQVRHVSRPLAFRPCCSSWDSRCRWRHILQTFIS